MEPEQHTAMETEEGLPSPTPQKQAQAPEMPASGSGRLDMLNTLFDKCLAYGLRQPSMQALAARFPGLPRPTIAALHDLYRQVLQHVQAHSLAEFSQICEEHEISRKLAELDELADQQPATTRPATSSCEPAARVVQTTSWLGALEEEEVALQQQLYEAQDTRRKLEELIAIREGMAEQLMNQYQTAITTISEVIRADTELTVWQ